MPVAAGSGLCRLIRARCKTLEIVCELVSKQAIGLLSPVTIGGEYCSECHRPYAGLLGTQLQGGSASQHAVCTSMIRLDRSRVRQ